MEFWRFSILYRSQIAGATSSPLDVVEDVGPNDAPLSATTSGVLMSDTTGASRFATHEHVRVTMRADLIVMTVTGIFVAGNLRLGGTFDRNAHFSEYTRENIR